MKNLFYQREAEVNCKYALIGIFSTAVIGIGGYVLDIFKDISPTDYLTVGIYGLAIIACACSTLCFLYKWNKAKQLSQFSL